jgi:hypothetical protein
VTPERIIDLANTAFVFGEWAIPGAALAALLGLTGGRRSGRALPAACSAVPFF